MLDYPFYYHVTVTEERFHSLRRERRLQAELGRVRRSPEPRPEGRRRWSVAAFIGLVVPNRAMGRASR